jgi:cyclopropane-fatty-acyl-phospholipid synthase
MAEKFPGSKITSVSNSHSQREYIEAVCRERSISNLQVVTADMNEFSPASAERFDRVVSVEMFEHMRNYETLLNRISSWLHDEGKLFVHIFCHREWAYPFETKKDTSWMARYFFTGGLMPSENIFDHFSNDLIVEEQHRWNGTHYQRTLEAWLQNQDADRERLLEMLAKIYGDQEARRWFQRWRMFFMASAELFGFAGGEEWFVSHYRVRKR